MVGIKNIGQGMHKIRRGKSFIFSASNAQVVLDLTFLQKVTNLESIDIDYYRGTTGTITGLNGINRDVALKFVNNNVLCEDYFYEFANANIICCGDGLISETYEDCDGAIDCNSNCFNCTIHSNYCDCPNNPCSTGFCSFAFSQNHNLCRPTCGELEHDCEICHRFDDPSFICACNEGRTMINGTCTDFNTTCAYDTDPDSIYIPFRDCRGGTCTIVQCEDENCHNLCEIDSKLEYLYDCGCIIEESCNSTIASYICINGNENDIFYEDGLDIGDTINTDGNLYFVSIDIEIELIFVRAINVKVDDAVLIFNSNITLNVVDLDISNSGLLFRSNVGIIGDTTLNSSLLNFAEGGYLKIDGCIYIEDDVDLEITIDDQQTDDFVFLEYQCISGDFNSVQLNYNGSCDLDILDSQSKLSVSFNCGSENSGTAGIHPIGNQSYLPYIIIGTAILVVVVVCIIYFVYSTNRTKQGMKNIKNRINALESGSSSN
eukprot:TRINITY_DN4435_c4_g1_i2.p1 TRINITY_DN4435_c4_g1~~TRINITY_DN4435_c4_g1_i2.p1  ORF type:complete len:489 (+),score=90.04 TRINITY_DN4435_c4_g1_i2:306-1772(+)